jgi:hypothetical protein
MQKANRARHSEVHQGQVHAISRHAYGQMKPLANPQFGDSGQVLNAAPCGWRGLSRATLRTCHGNISNTDPPYTG